MPLPHPDIDIIAQVLQLRLATSWREAIAKIIDEWRTLESEGRLNPTTSRLAVQHVLHEWPEVTAQLYDDIVDRLFTLGFATGVADTGLRAVPDAGDAMTVQWLKQSPQGFIPALRGMADDGRRAIEKVIAGAYEGRDELGEPQPFDLDDMVERTLRRVDVGENRATLIVRTETAKVTALGRISAWGDDPQRDYYEYHWIATHDTRVKDVSLVFEAEGPYTWEQIKRRWEVDHNQPQLVRNRRTGRMEYQVSAFNCRCTVARTPKQPEQLFNEGKITRDQYEDMEAVA